MTDFLLRMFVRGPIDAHDSATRTACGTLAGIVGLVCNALLCAGKLCAGLVFGSVAIVADALNNLSDASSNAVSLAGFRLAAKAPDDEHPYGHARYEYLAALAVSVTIMGIGFSLLYESVVKIIHPVTVTFSWLSVTVLAASILVKLWLAAFNRNVGQRIGSETLMTAAADSRNDVLSTGAVLISTVLCRLTGFDRLDGLMGTAVAGFILWSGWHLVLETLSPLLGESPSPELVRRIEQTVMNTPGVLGMHDLMVHDYGPGHQFASLHVELPAETDPLAAHALLDGIEDALWQNDHILATLHADPIVTQDVRVGVLRTHLSEKVRELDPRLAIHDLRLMPRNTAGRIDVRFDLELPPGYSGDRMVLLETVRRFVAEEDPTYCAIVKVEQSYARADTPADAAKK